MKVYTVWLRLVFQREFHRQLLHQYGEYFVDIRHVLPLLEWKRNVVE